MQSPSEKKLVKGGTVLHMHDCSTSVRKTKKINGSVDCEVSLKSICDFLSLLVMFMLLKLCAIAAVTVIILYQK